MKIWKLLYLSLPLLAVFSPPAEARGCVGRLTLEQFEVCQALRAHNDEQRRQSRQAVEDAERRFQAQREAQIRALEQERLRVQAEAEARALERALAAQWWQYDRALASTTLVTAVDPFPYRWRRHKPRTGPVWPRHAPLAVPITPSYRRAQSDRR